MRFFIFLLCLNVSICISQNTFCNADSIPDKNLYFIGDLHLDYLYFPSIKAKNREEIRMHDINTKMQIIDFLVTKKKVNRILMEWSPLYEYYFIKSIECDTPKYFKNAIGFSLFSSEMEDYRKFIHEGKLTPNSFRFIDVAPRVAEEKNCLEYVKVLFSIFYVESIFKNKISPIYEGKETEDYRVSIDSMYYRFQKKDSLYKIANVLYNQIYEADVIDAKLLNSTLTELIQNEVTKSQLKQKLGRWYDLFIRTSYSYVNSYSLKDVEISNMGDNAEREALLKKTIMENCSDSVRCCVIIGLSHVLVNKYREIENVTTLLRKENKLPFYTMSIFYNYKDLRDELPVHGVDVKTLPHKRANCKTFLHILNKEDAIVY